ncbi:MAG: hypothetical protein ACR2JP_03570 [Acidimicrobiia bacterium]
MRPADAVAEDHRGGVVAAMYTEQVRDLLGYGATEVLVVAQGLGTGELPGEDEARTVVVPAPSVTSITEEVKTWIEFAEHPPPEAVAAFDPEGTALCLLDPFATAATYCGRAALGGRTPAVAALEDRTVADGIWTPPECSGRRPWWCRSTPAWRRRRTPVSTAVRGRRSRGTPLRA